MFEDMLGESLDSKAANDVSALVPMYANDELERAFTLPVMSVAFSWSREMLGALVTFCWYQMDTAGFARRDLRGSLELRRHLFHELVEHSFMCLVPRQIARNSWTTVARGRSTRARARCSSTSSKEGLPNDSITRRSASCKHDGKMISSEFRTFHDWTS